MRGNLIAMKVPTSISRKLRLKHRIQGVSEEIHTLSPQDRQQKIHDYLKNINRTSPIYYSDNPTKVRQLSPTSLTLNTQKTITEKKSETLISYSKAKLKKKKAKSVKKGKSVLNVYKDPMDTLSDTIEYVPVNNFLRIIGNHSAAKLNRNIFDSLRTLNDLKYLKVHSRTPGPGKSSIFAIAQPAKFLPFLSHAYKHLIKH